MAKHSSREIPGRKGKVGKPLRNPARILSDRAKIAAMLVRGLQLVEIGERLQLSYEILRFDVREIKKQWADSAIRDLDEAQQIAVRKLENLEVVYWDAWERSVKGKKRITERSEARRQKKKNGAQSFKVVEGSTMREETYGDPRFLLGVRQCIMDVAKIRGVVQDTRGGNNGDVPPVPLNGGQATFIIMPASAKPREIPKDITAQSQPAALSPPG